MEKNVQLNHDDTNLQPVSATEVITDKKEDFPLDTMLVGMWDTLKWMSGTLKPLERAIASAGDSGVGFVKKFKFTSPYYGYLVLAGNIYIGFGQAGSKPVNDVVKVDIPGASNSAIKIKTGTTPLVFLSNTTTGIIAAGNAVQLYTTKKDSANNTCDETKEFWYVKKNADGTDNYQGAVSYLVIGQVEAYT